MPIKKRTSGNPNLRGGGGGGGKITINDHTGDPISTAVSTIEWQTLDKLGFTAVVDPDDETKVIIGEAPEFLDPIVWSSAQVVDVRVAESDPAEPDTYLTNGWEGTVKKGSTGDLIFNSTVGRGFGVESNITVKTYHAGVLVDDVLFVCGANGTQTDGNVSVTVSNYAPDGDGSVFGGKLRVVVDGDGLIGSTNSGACRVEISFLEQKWTERKNISQDVFRDKNTDTPNIAGTPTVREHDDPAERVIKYISGIGYYTTGSKFTVEVPDVDNHNEDSSRPSESLMVDSSNFGITPYNTSPWTDNVSWTNFDELDTTDGIDYVEDIAINEPNFRHVGEAVVGNVIRDSWDAAANVDSNTLKVCIDTHTRESTDLIEYFDKENKRLTGVEDDTDPLNVIPAYSAPWDSELPCVSGEAVFFNGMAMHGTDVHRINENVAGALGSGNNLTTFLPDETVAGVFKANPNYAGHDINKSAVFFRKFKAGSSTYAGFNMNIVTNGNVQTLLESGDLKVYVWKSDSTNPTTVNTTFPPEYNPNDQTASTVNSIWLHGTNNYNFGLFQDGAVQDNAGSTCRTKVTGTVVEATFGGNDLATNSEILVRFEFKKGVTIEEVAVTFK